MQGKVDHHRSPIDSSCDIPLPNARVGAHDDLAELAAGSRRGWLDSACFQAGGEEAEAVAVAGAPHDTASGDAVRRRANYLLRRGCAGPARHARAYPC
jgi:hypothetical protein